jgi:hypothetical protein
MWTSHELIGTRAIQESRLVPPIDATYALGRLGGHEKTQAETKGHQHGGGHYFANFDLHFPAPRSDAAAACRLFGLLI